MGEVCEIHGLGVGQMSIIILAAEHSALVGRSCQPISLKWLGANCHIVKLAESLRVEQPIGVGCVGDIFDRNTKWHTAAEGIALALKSRGYSARTATGVV